MSDRPNANLTRRRFLSLAAFSTGATVLGSQFVSAVTHTVGSAATQVRKFLPSFNADASTFGNLVGANGEALPAPAAAPTPAPGERRRWVMVIDLARCDGCRVCTDSCTAMHKVPAGQEWIRVYKMTDDRTGSTYFMPKPCLQCDNSPCTKVCPVGATYKREDGIVLIDQDRCIGCRYCVAACPYSSRFFNWAEPTHTPEELAMAYDVEMNMPHRKGVAEKCIFCPGLLRQGQLPACAEHCAMGAIYVGDELEDVVTNSQGEAAPFRQLIQQNGGYRLMEELNTQPRVWYLPPRNRMFGSPQPDSSEMNHG